MDYHHRHMEVSTGAVGGPAPHWGYGGGGWGAPAPAPAPRASKRAHSESDDCDDAFSEESSKDATSPGGGGGGGGGDSCQLMTRKRRRGVIEKKRRDRINTSLSELKRLVPSAYEKQGSAKLEKAEILQLTVDHLKMLHAKGLDTFSYDPQRYAMDYHSIGFRECASEVARYLVSCEGLDIQDPLRLRLMSHLQCFAAQRELAAKSCSNPWGYSSATPAQYPPAPAPAPPSSLHHPLAPAAPVTDPAPQPPGLPHAPAHHAAHHSGYAEASRLEPPPSSSSTSASTLAASSLTSLTTLAPTSGYPAPAPHYPSPASHPYPPYHHPPPPPPPPHHPHHQYNHNSSKPYRPWGAELAY